MYINKEDIKLACLNKDNIEQYAEQIKRFESKRERYTKVLKDTYAEMTSKHQLLDSDENRKYRNTTILLIDDKKNDVICFCSYSCSHVKIDAELFLPAIEIETFAMNKDYSGAKRVIDGDDKYSCSDYAIRFCINRFEKIKEKYIYASLVKLYSDTNREVLKFYKRNNFEQFPASWRFLKDATTNHEFCFFRMLK